MNSSGSATDTYEYDAFGNLIGSSGGMANEHLYRGERLESALGLYDNRARAYAADKGRFWTRDTYEGDRTTPLTLSLFTYASGSPVAYADPNGHRIVPQGTLAMDLIAKVRASQAGAASLLGFLDRSPEEVDVHVFNSGSGLKLSCSGFDVNGCATPIPVVTVPSKFPPFVNALRLNLEPGTYAPKVSIEVSDGAYETYSSGDESFSPTMDGVLVHELTHAAEWFLGAGNTVNFEYDAYSMESAYYIDGGASRAAVDLFLRGHSYQVFKNRLPQALTRATILRASFSGGYEGLDAGGAK